MNWPSPLPSNWRASSNGRPSKLPKNSPPRVKDIPGIAGLEIAGNGYINVRLDRAYYADGLLRDSTALKNKTAGKIVVEHTNINPNKAAHIGHLRNAVLGDTSFVRMLRQRFSTVEVEVQNYIDNTGVQVADVVAGFHFLEKENACRCARPHRR